MAARPAILAEPGIRFCCWCFFPLFLSFFFHRQISEVTWPIVTQTLPYFAWPCHDTTTWCLF